VDRRTHSASGELLYVSPELTLSLGGRADGGEGFETEFSPRVGASYRLGRSDTRVKGSWGEGFKLPSFFALGDPNIGNPGLRPEKARGMDIGLEHRLDDRLRLAVTYFHNRFQDLVDFSPQQFRLVNRSAAVTQGLELEASPRLTERLSLTGHLAFLDAELEGTDEPLRDRPRWRGGLALDWEIGIRSRLRWETLWVGPRFDF
jgi:iron complex outermembrane receptor protein/vitamin B12 transporter